ncbi:MAG: PEP-CTERM sorting domain-containing protein [Candidatus Doudnabacteria bacterium]|nr:PEP-CTERM sorting domain-containing protein [Candidatus Doudnabacteria bacterium]
MRKLVLCLFLTVAANAATVNIYPTLDCTVGGTSAATTGLCANPNGPTTVGFVVVTNDMLNPSDQNDWVQVLEFPNAGGGVATNFRLYSDPLTFPSFGSASTTVPFATLFSVYNPAQGFVYNIYNPPTNGGGNVPESGTMLMVAGGLAGIVAVRRKG